MSDYFEPGDRVRVTYEGIVKNSDPYWLRVFTDGDTINANTVRLGGPHTIERIPDPEPEWQFGDHVIDASGVVWRRSPRGWWFAGVDPKEYDDDFPARPLTLLVRDGKPVSS